MYYEKNRLSHSIAVFEYRTCTCMHTGKHCLPIGDKIYLDHTISLVERKKKCFGVKRSLSSEVQDFSANNCQFIVMEYTL